MAPVAAAHVNPEWRKSWRRRSVLPTADRAKVHFLLSVLTKRASAFSPTKTESPARSYVRVQVVLDGGEDALRNRDAPPTGFGFWGLDDLGAAHPWPPREFDVESASQQVHVPSPQSKELASAQLTPGGEEDRDPQMVRHGVASADTSAMDAMGALEPSLPQHPSPDTGFELLLRRQRLPA